MRKELILIGLIFWAFTSVKAQFHISGEVRDESNEPIFGVLVKIHELRTGVTTDFDGRFGLHSLNPGNYHLHFTAIGYHAQTIDTVLVDQNLELQITMEESVNELHEVVIETDPLKIDQEESSLILHAVDKDYIDKNTGASLLNSIDNIEGISTINQGVGVSKPVIRGLSFNRVAVTEHGIKQEGQQWGADHGLEIDQYSVEKLEILKGPASLMYGSDAMAGVVNIKHSIDVEEGKNQLAIKPFYRSVNQTKGITGEFKGREKSIVYKVQGTLQGYSDYSIPADSFDYLGFRLPIEEQRLKNTAGKERHFSTTVGVNKRWGFSHLTVSNFNQNIGVFQGATGFARGYSIVQDEASNIELPSQLINHFKVISNNSISIGEDWLEFDLGYQINNRKEFEEAVSHGFPIDLDDSLGTQLKLKTFSGNIRMHHDFSKKWEAVVGTQFEKKNNEVGGFDFIIPNYSQTQIGVYQINKFDLANKWVLNGGLRVDYGNQQASSSFEPFYYQKQYLDSVQRTPEIDKRYFNTSGSVGVSFNPKKTTSYKLNIGKTFRLPSIAELTSNGAHHGTFRFEKGNENLTPESGYQLDLGYAYEKGKLHFTLSPFINYFSNFIYLAPSNRFATAEIDGVLYPYPVGGQLYEYKQNRAVYSGGEFAIHWHKGNFELGLNGDIVINKNLDTDLPLPFTPAPSLNPSVFYEVDTLGKVQDVFIGITAQIIGAQNRVERNELSTEASQVLNLSSGFSCGKKHQFDVRFQVQNVLNTSYYNHLSRYRLLNLPEPGRNFVVSVGYGLK